jgi:hypothetical protein
MVVLVSCDSDSAEFPLEMPIDKLTPILNRRNTKPNTLSLFWPHYACLGYEELRFCSKQME